MTKNNLITVYEGTISKNCLVAEILVVYLTSDERFGIVLESVDLLSHTLTIRDEDAEGLRKQGVIFTDEAIKRIRINERNWQKTINAFHEWLSVSPRKTALASS